MRFDRIALHGAAVAIAMMSAAAARAENSATGLWIDHTGRGAVEITDCNGKLCGHVAWVDDAKNSDQCGKQIIGNVKSVGKNKWDNGWIVDPDKDPDKKYDVEITPQGDQKLKVMGYAGMKFLSETMVWTRAPADLKKCGEDVARAPEPVPAAPAPAPDQDKDAPVASPAPAPAPAPEEAKPERSASSGKKKDCKMDIGFAVITFPCQD